METKIESIISQNLTDLRKSRNLKQAELSEAIGYSDKTISRWENGTSVPDISTLVKLADFYHISIEDLIHENAAARAGEEEEKEKKETQEKFINRLTLSILSVFTIWLLATLVFVGTIMWQDMYLWESFICALPLSAIVLFRYTRKDFSLRWLNFTLLTITIVGTVTSIYLILIYYNFWPLFIIIAPLEGMCVIFTLFKRPNSSKK